MRTRSFLSWLCVVLVACGVASLAHAQRPYIGYVYPAGGQQGTTFQVRLGGQALADLDGVIISGKGVTGRVVEYLPRLNNQELTLLQEQLRELRTSQSAVAAAPAMQPSMQPEEAMMMMGAPGKDAVAKPAVAKPEDLKALREKIQSRVSSFVQLPACASIANIAVVELTIAPDAEPGDREIRLSTLRGVTNPLVFQVGTLREYAAAPMPTSPQQVLGKEAQALRKRAPRDGDSDVALPCTVNGQLGPGEISRFHFKATKGQHLVFSAQCRFLIPYIADAVPGWFQAVLSLHDAKGREIAYDDDYAFKPDPVILFTVPEDGDYTLAIHDAIYRGREDFIYRVSMGELPFVTSCFPLGSQVDKPVTVTFEGVNLPEKARQQTVTFHDAGAHILRLRSGTFVSNAVPFAVDALPSVAEVETNNSEATAQAVSGPVMVDGRIDSPNDVDVYRVSGKAGESLAVEVTARRLDSPLDSFVTVTDAHGKVLALNDDSMDLGDGVNTHHADSYLVAKLPDTGDYFVRVTDRAHKGGAEYGYRLRLGPPQPDFELRIVGSSLALRFGSTATATVYVLRKDDFDGPVRLTLVNPPAGFSAQPVFVPKGQTVGRLVIKAPARRTQENVRLTIAGNARSGTRELVHVAVAAEDKMQAFLWRQLVPAEDFVVTVFDPAVSLPTTRTVPVLPPKPKAEASTPAPTTAVAAAVASTTGAAPATPTLASATTVTPAAAASTQKFSKQQVAGRLRQLKLLYEAGLLTDSFYLKKVEECEAAQ